jgi:sugar phosphate isomerase/epimerase
MQFGFVSAILAEQSFEEVITFAANNGFTCVELMTWPKGKAERRYAGVTHIDVDSLDDQKAGEILKFAQANNVAISALGYYPNPLDPDLVKRTAYIEHIRKMILAAARLGINRITTFIGKDPNKTLDENFDLFVEVWTPLIALAEANRVQVAIENCPMYFTMDQWPGGLNLATTPSMWRRMFAAISSPYFGLNYDPSHLVWQQMDYIKPIYEFKDRLHHVHFKDIKIYRDKLNDVGIMATPLEFMSPKLPGQGDVDWGKYVSALNDIRYNGPACIEVEDKAYESSLSDCQKALLTSRNYLNQFIL